MASLRPEINQRITDSVNRPAMRYSAADVRRERSAAAYLARLAELEAEARWRDRDTHYK